MATNHYFQSGKSIGSRGEQHLIEDLIIESIKIYGQDVFYMPRISFREDRILGEDTMNYFNQAHPIEMYLQNVQGWAGNPELFSKFGISVNDQATFIVSKRRWEDGVKRNIEKLDLPQRPLEGDLIYFPKTNSLFAIKYVEHLDPFFQLGKFHIYSIQCELYQYSSEIIDTGIADIDNNETELTANELFKSIETEDGEIIETEQDSPLTNEETNEHPFDDATDFDVEDFEKQIIISLNDPRYG